MTRAHGAAILAAYGGIMVGLFPLMYNGRAVAARQQREDAIGLSNALKLQPCSSIDRARIVLLKDDLRQAKFGITPSVKSDGVTAYNMMAGVVPEKVLQANGLKESIK